MHICKLLGAGNEKIICTKNINYKNEINESLFLKIKKKKLYNVREKIEKLCDVTYARKQYNNETLYSFKLSFLVQFCCVVESQ